LAVSSKQASQIPLSPTFTTAASHRMPFRVSGLSRKMVAIRSSHGMCSRFMTCQPSVKARPAGSLDIA
jgi:hypothetical protein